MTFRVPGPLHILHKLTPSFGGRFKVRFEHVLALLVLDGAGGHRPSRPGQLRILLTWQCATLSLPLTRHLQHIRKQKL